MTLVSLYAEVDTENVLVEFTVTNHPKTLLQIHATNIRDRPSHRAIHARTHAHSLF